LLWRVKIEKNANSSGSIVKFRNDFNPDFKWTVLEGPGVASNQQRKTRQKTFSKNRETDPIEILSKAQKFPF
jgi:hypothetical protein